MFGFLATLFCGCVIAVDDIQKGSLHANKRNEAIRKGEKIYWDGTKDHFRSTETDELVFHRVIDDRDEDVGIKTHKVYKCVDHREELRNRVDKMYLESNIELEKEGMNFYWKRMPQWDGKDKNGVYHIGYAQVDKENGKPIHFIKSYDNDKTYCIQYSDETGKLMHTYIGEDGRTKFDCRYISSDEYWKKYWLAQDRSKRA